MLSQLSILDVFFVILLLGTAYKGSKSGVAGQVLTLAGALLMLLVSLRYYTLFSEAIFGFLLQNWSKPVSFFLIMIVVFMITRILERITGLFISEDLALIERVGGVAIASFRSVIYVGIAGIFLLLVPVHKVQLTVTDSLAASHFVKMDLELYEFVSRAIDKNARDIRIKDLTPELNPKE